MTGLFLARSPARALKRWVSSAVRPRVDTISPFSRNASETEIAWSSNPPGLLRKSMMKLLSLSPAWVERSVIAFFRSSVVCSLNCVTRMNPTSSLSSRERTERTWMRARIIVTSTGLSWPLRMILSFILEFSGPRILSTAWLRVSPCTGSPSRWVMMSLAMMPALAAGVSSIGATTLMRPSSIVTSMPRPPNFAAGLHLHVAEALGIHVARMRIEPGQHAVDRRFNEFAVVGLFHIVRPHALEYVAEQAQLPVGIGGGRLCACPIEHDTGLSCDQRHGNAGRRTEENQGSFAHHHPRTFWPSFTGLDRQYPVLAELHIVVHFCDGPARNQSWPK